MCVILIGNADKILLHYEKAMDANPHGSGLAWLDKKNGKRVVRFIKGIVKEDDAKSVLTSLKNKQCVFHARIATVGGAIPSLTHPFPVEINPDLSLEGKSDLVLFQNGHISSWEKLRGERHDSNAWSDSRAVAHGLAVGTVKNLTDTSVQGSRFVLYAPDFLGYYPKRDWSHVKGGVLASNRDFLNPISYSWRAYDWRSDYEFAYGNECDAYGTSPADAYAMDRAYYRAKRRARYGHWRGHGVTGSSNVSMLKEEVKEASEQDEIVRQGKGKWVWPMAASRPVYQYELTSGAEKDTNLSLPLGETEPDMDDITSAYLGAREEDEEIRAWSDRPDDEPPPPSHNFDIRYDCSGQPIEEEA